MPGNSVEVIDLTLTDSESESEFDDSPGEASLAAHETPATSEEARSPIDHTAVAPTAKMALHATLASTSDAHLRRIIANLVDRVPAVQQALQDELLIRSPQSLKTYARWKMCKNCKNEYEVDAERDPEECTFHSGELEVDEESFVDWDEDCHGPIDTPETREQFPESFFWTCCDENSRSDGCEVQEHEPAISRKKPRLA